MAIGRGAASVARDGVRADSAPQALSIDLLLFFNAVAEELSFTRAARRLGIDQSWLSHKIRQLEGGLSCTLFARTTRRIELTPAGLALLDSSRNLARAADDARRAAARVSAGLQGTLRVGALPYGFWSPDRVRLVDRFIAEHPETELEVTNGPSLHLLDRLRRGELDLAFASWPFDPAGLETLQVRIDRYGLLVPVGHPLEALPEIRLEDLAGQRMVVPNERHNPHTFRSLFGPFVDAGVVALQPAEFHREAMIRLAISQNALLIRNERDTSERPEFVARPLCGHRAENRKCLVRRRNYLTPAIEAFWTLARADGARPVDLTLV